MNKQNVYAAINVLAFISCVYFGVLGIVKGNHSSFIFLIAAILIAFEFCLSAPWINKLKLFVLKGPAAKKMVAAMMMLGLLVLYVLTTRFS